MNIDDDFEESSWYRRPTDESSSEDACDDVSDWTRRRAAFLAYEGIELDDDSETLRLSIERRKKARSEFKNGSIISLTDDTQGPAQFNSRYRHVASSRVEEDMPTFDDEVQSMNEIDLDDIWESEILSRVTKNTSARVHEDIAVDVPFGKQGTIGYRPVAPVPALAAALQQFQRRVASKREELRQQQRIDERIERDRLSIVERKAAVMDKLRAAKEALSLLQEAL